jgi:ribokinase
VAEHYDVCVVGSANLDLVATTAHHPKPGETVLGSGYAEHPGGKGLNQAVSAARSGASTAFAGALGDDAAGARLRGVLTAESIDAAAVTIVDVPTGRALITVDDEGENSIVVIPGANATVSTDIALPSASVVLAQLEIPIGAVVAALVRAKSAGSTVILNPAPAAPLPPELVAACDVIVPNEHELVQLGGAAAVLAAGCAAVVTTLGADGADVSNDRGTTRVESFAVEPIDTTGAGDAFCGALAARLAAGDELLDAVRWATAAGALATTVHGAVPAQPTAKAIEALIARN